MTCVSGLGAALPFKITARRSGTRQAQDAADSGWTDRDYFSRYRSCRVSRDGRGRVDAGTVAFRATLDIPASAERDSASDRRLLPRVSRRVGRRGHRGGASPSPTNIMDFLTRSRAKDGWQQGLGTWSHARERGSRAHAGSCGTACGVSRGATMLGGRGLAPPRRAFGYPASTLSPLCAKGWVGWARGAPPDVSGRGSQSARDSFGAARRVAGGAAPYMGRLAPLWGRGGRGTPPA